MCRWQQRPREYALKAPQANTVTDHDLLTVPVELIGLGIDPEQANALYRNRPNTVRPFRRRGHGRIANRSDLLPGLSHAQNPLRLSNAARARTKLTRF